AFDLVAVGILKKVALGGEVGESGRDVGENLLGAAEFALSSRDFGVDAAAPAGTFACLRTNGFFFSGEASDCLFGIDGKPFVALCIGGNLQKPQIEFGNSVLRAG